MAVVVAAPGSCGELVQGVIGETSLHISCPINLFSWARVEQRRGDQFECRPKARRAADAVRAAAEKTDIGLWVGVRSDLPTGKGFASSTADIAAAAAATALTLGVELTAAELADLAVRIEPTDGTIFPGIVAFDHKTGSRVLPLGPAPPLAVTFVDTGGSIDTVEFNRRKITYSRRRQWALETAFQMAAAGLKRRDWSLLGRAATISAKINQSVLLKPKFDDLVEMADEIRAYGVVVAHSGTVYGVLHDRDPSAMESHLRALGFGPARTAGLTDGGWRVWVS